MNRKKLALFLAVAMIITLFCGCGSPNGTNTSSSGTNKNSTPANNTSSPDSTSEKSGTDSGTETQASVETASPYKFAAGNFAKDANGYAIEKYEYEQPFCTTDEVLSFWSVTWVPTAIPEEGYGSMPYPVFLDSLTGVHIEYVLVSAQTREQNFGVLTASDDLCDLSACGTSFFKGTVEESIDQGYFANIHDYIEYCPNYIYEVKNRNPDDKKTYNDCFYKDNIIPSFKSLTDKVIVGLSSQIRADWLADCGRSVKDIVTFEDLKETLMMFKSQIDTCQFPWAMLSYVEMPGSYTLNAFDTLPYVSQSGTLPLVFQIDGKVQISNTTQADYDVAEFLAGCHKEGLIDPDWTGAIDNTPYVSKATSGSIGYIAISPTGTASYEAATDDPDCEWVALEKLVKYPGQVIHVGGQLTRYKSGLTNISAKCENIPLAVTWCDWSYSDAGVFACSYGKEGIMWNRDKNGNIKLTDFVTQNPDGITANWVMTLYGLNILNEHGMEYSDRYYHYDGGEKVLSKYDTWAKFYENNYDGAYEWPVDLALTDEQTEEISKYKGDVSTYIAENYLSFIDGSKSLTEWDAYVEGVYSIGLSEVQKVYQTSLDDYYAKKA